MAPERTIQFKLTLTDEEKRMLFDIAEAEGLTAADYIRQHVRRAYALKHANPKSLAEALAVREVREQVAQSARLADAFEKAGKAKRRRRTK